jgi:tetratricopeptide (TPR) repeat protein
MDDWSNNLVAALYTTPGVDSAKVDACVDRYLMLQGRGQKPRLETILLENKVLRAETLSRVVESVNDEMNRGPTPAAKKPEPESKKAERISKTGAEPSKKKASERQDCKTASERSARPEPKGASDKRRGAAAKGPGPGSESPLPASPSPASAEKPPIDRTNLALAIALGVIVLLGLARFIPRSEPERDEAPFPAARDTEPSLTSLALERAEQLIKDGKFSQARERVQEAKRATDGLTEELAEIKRLETLLEEIETFRQRATDVRSRAQALLDKKEYQEALSLLDSTLVTKPELAELSELKALSELRGLADREVKKIEAQVLAEKARAEANRPKGPGDESGDESEIRVGTLQRGEIKPIEKERLGLFDKASWQSRVEAARRWVSDEKTRLTALRAREQEVVKARSEKKRFDVPLTSSFSLRNAKVTRFDEDGFALADGRAEMGFRWDLAKPNLALEVRELGVIEDSADSQLRFGQFCVKQRAFKEARRAFEKAVALSPRLGPRLPDLNLLERAATTFHGNFQRLGGELVSFDYPFDEDGELSDFLFSFRSPRVSGGQAFIPKGSKGEVHTLRLKDVLFKDQLRVDVELGLSPGAVLLIEITSGGKGLQVAYYRDQGALQFVDAADGKVLFSDTRVAKNSNRVQLVYAGRVIKAYVGSKASGRLSAPARLNDIQVLLGGSSNSGVLPIERVKLSGRVDGAWLRKTFQEADDALAGLLADEGVGAPLVSWQRPEEPLSADEELAMRGIPTQARALVTRARLLLKLGRQEQIEEAADCLQKSLQIAPENPLALFEYGSLAFVYGQLYTALGALNRAIASTGGFHEAIALRAMVLATMGRKEEAEKDLKAAFEIRPDSALAFLAQSRLLFDSKEIQKARDELEVAYALWPRDVSIGRRLRNFTFLLRGPPWDRRYEVETAHFRVLSDISEARTRFYADHLEWIHAYYERLFPFARKEGKATALIFNTREGYCQYSDLTANDRVEWTLGVYRPAYEQLLLFEESDGDTEETLDTLYHEGFHQFIDRVITDMPPWLNEGLAEYFGPTRFNSRGELVSAGALNSMRLDPLMDYLSKGGRPMPFADLMRFSLRQFQAGNVSLHYAQSWAMVHFFLHGPASQRELLQRYFDRLRQGADASQAFKSTFGATDISRVELEWRRYLNSLRRN